MNLRIRKLVERLSNLGTLPGDSEKEKLHKRFLIYVALLMTGGGLMWGGICLFHGLFIPSTVPFGYVVLTAVNLTVFSLAKSFGVARVIQLAMSLVLPFLFQWSLGGFVPSGSVMLWAMTAVLGALTFQEVRVTLWWFLGYLALVVVTGILDSEVARFASGASTAPMTELFVVNVIGVSIIVFGLMIYFVRSNEIAYEKLALTNMALIESQGQLVQAEKMASLGSLTAGLAHEINTPVGVINSNADISRRCIETIVASLEKSSTLEELRSDGSFHRSLETLRTNNKVLRDGSFRITHLLGSLKNFTRLDEASLQEANLHEGIDSALDLLGHYIENRIEVVRDYGDIPGVRCYPGEMNQVFMHILTNAIEAIPDSGKITIRSFGRGKKVHVQFEDSGVGIPPEQVERVFDPAFTKKGSKIRARLGLFTSYQIVDKHGGRITVESEVGKGTTVTVTLPRSDSGAHPSS